MSKKEELINKILQGEIKPKTIFLQTLDDESQTKNPNLDYINHQERKKLAEDIKNNSFPNLLNNSKDNIKCNSDLFADVENKLVNYIYILLDQYRFETRFKKNRFWMNKNHQLVIQDYLKNLSDHYGNEKNKLESDCNFLDLEELYKFFLNKQKRLVRYGFFGKKGQLYDIINMYLINYEMIACLKKIFKYLNLLGDNQRIDSFNKLQSLLNLSDAQFNLSDTEILIFIKICHSNIADKNFIFNFFMEYYKKNKKHLINDLNRYFAKNEIEIFIQQGYINPDIIHCLIEPDSQENKEFNSYIFDKKSVDLLAENFLTESASCCENEYARKNLEGFNLEPPFSHFSNTMTPESENIFKKRTWLNKFYLIMDSLRLRIKKKIIRSFDISDLFILYQNLIRTSKNTQKKFPECDEVYKNCLASIYNNCELEINFLSVGSENDIINKYKRYDNFYIFYVHSSNMWHLCYFSNENILENININNNELFQDVNNFINKRSISQLGLDDRNTIKELISKKLFQAHQQNNLSKPSSSSKDPYYWKLKQFIYSYNQYEPKDKSNLNQNTQLTEEKSKEESPCEMPKVRTEIDDESKDKSNLNQNAELIENKFKQNSSPVEMGEKVQMELEEVKKENLNLHAKVSNFEKELLNEKAKNERLEIENNLLRQDREDSENRYRSLVNLMGSMGSSKNQDNINKLNEIKLSLQYDRSKGKIEEIGQENSVNPPTP